MQHGLTPLHLAVQFAEHLVPLLLEHNVDVNTVNNNGRTPLLDTIHQKGNDEIVSALLLHGADATKADNVSNNCCQLSYSQTNKILT